METEGDAAQPDSRDPDLDGVGEALDSLAARDAVRPAAIRADLPCECGYNLRGLNTLGRCPECGRGIAATIAARRPLPALAVAADRAGMGWKLCALGEAMVPAACLGGLSPLLILMGRFVQIGAATGFAEGAFADRATAWAAAIVFTTLVDALVLCAFFQLRGDPEPSAIVTVATVLAGGALLRTLTWTRLAVAVCGHFGRPGTAADFRSAARLRYAGLGLLWAVAVGAVWFGVAGPGDADFTAAAVTLIASVGLLAGSAFGQATATDRLREVLRLPSAWLGRPTPGRGHSRSAWPFPHDDTNADPVESGETGDPDAPAAETVDDEGRTP
jgi:hypothetical protein